MSKRRLDTDKKATDTRETSSRNRKSRPQKGRRSKSFSSPKEAAAESTNDPAWYSTSPELLRDAASIPFSWPTGTRLNDGSFISNKSVAGVMSIPLKQVIGTATSVNDPVNVASSAIYSFVRHANSGHSNYDAPDLMIYLLSISSVYSFITWCQRLLGLIMVYDQRNRYLPDMLIKMNWVDPTSLRNNISNFRFWLNTFINKVASFAIPGVMPYFSRMAFLYSNYYIDGPSIKDQFYMYTPANNEFLWFFIDDTSHLGKLSYHAIPTSSGSSSTVEDIMTFGDQMFDKIWAQEDFGIMSGDILKAYGDNIIKLSTVPEMFVLQPVYDAMFLHQFKNAKVFSPEVVSVGDIYVMADGYISQVVQLNPNADAKLLKATRQILSTNSILSSDFEQPTPEVVIESTRLMPGWDDDTLFIHCGSEIPMFAYTAELNYQNIGNPTYSIVAVPRLVHSNFNALAWRLAMVTNFKYSPEFFGVETIGDNGLADGSTYRLWDVDNYAVLSPEDLLKLHQTALMSMLAVPSIGKVS